MRPEAVWRTISNFYVVIVIKTLAMAVYLSIISLTNTQRIDLVLSVTFCIRSSH